MVLEIKLRDFVVEGDLNLPNRPKASVLMVHGSGSGRNSPRNKWVADYLYEQGIATFLCDLADGLERESGFADLEVLAERVEQITSELLQNPNLVGLPFFYFGSSLGAAVAVLAASKLPKTVVSGIVSRGGRLDYTQAFLGRISCPMLLLVGSKDREVLAINEACFNSLSVPKALTVIEGAGHLFEEPGMLDKVGKKTWEWMRDILDVSP
jgi:pimeloyl-ACP methyl ester carboxylesterase